MHEPRSAIVVPFALPTELEAIRLDHVNNARLGVLVKGSGLGTCGVPNFDGAGNVVSFAAICYTYDYIGK